MTARALHVDHRLVLNCIEHTAGFRALRDEWQELHGACPGATPFTSWEWLFSWWQAYRAGKRLRILTWRLDGMLVGVVPLYSTCAMSAVGTKATVLKMLGDGSSDSDYLGFLIRPQCVASVLHPFGIWLSKERSWDVVVLRELPEGSGLANALCELAQRHGLRLRTAYGRCGVVDLPATFEEFLRDRQPRFRTKLRALLKRMDESGLTLEVDCSAAQLRQRLRSLFLLHQQRWQSAGAPGIFEQAAKRLFYAHFVPRFARRGWLRFYSLRRGDTYVAHQLCFGADGVTYLLQEAFDVANPSASYGQMLRAAVMRHLIQQGEGRYDFLGGFSKHKEDWGARPTRTTHLLAARGSLRGWVYMSAPRWRSYSANVLKQALPAVALRILKRTPAASP